MQTGQRVQVRWSGELGTIISLDNRDALLRMDTPDEEGVSEYWESRSEIQVLPSTPVSEPADFDQGLGIGGLGRYEELPPTPTAKQIQTEQQRVAKLRRCRRCGALEGGAMFTTDPERRVCDDCFE